MPLLIWQSKELIISFLGGNTNTKMLSFQLFTLHFPPFLVHCHWTWWVNGQTYISRLYKAGLLMFSSLKMNVTHVITSQVLRSISNFPFPLLFFLSRLSMLYYFNLSSYSKSCSLIHLSFSSSLLAVFLFHVRLKAKWYPNTHTHIYTGTHTIISGILRCLFISTFLDSSWHNLSAFSPIAPTPLLFTERAPSLPGFLFPISPNIFSSHKCNFDLSFHARVNTFCDPFFFNLRMLKTDKYK